ncbi:hypothetical protein RUM43_012586 [Polyplax serrata]|uniref:DM13 domain-containing protein n=1 Tax=Polyplax serrata TaxID=468196 RepID=A0AAN8S3Z3_POLSC
MWDRCRRGRKKSVVEKLIDLSDPSVDLKGDPKRDPPQLQPPGKLTPNEPFCLPAWNTTSTSREYGRLLGEFEGYAHDIEGVVYAVDDSTIFVKGFTYDGTAPDAFFWIGKTPRPNPDGIILPHPENYTGRDPPILKSYYREDVILRLPVGKRLRDMKWLSIWCRRFTLPCVVLGGEGGNGQSGRKSPGTEGVDVRIGAGKKEMAGDDKRDEMRIDLMTKSMRFQFNL